MSKIGKRIPGFIKKPILAVKNRVEYMFFKIYEKAGKGEIWFPDKAYQKWDYKVHTGRKLNMRNPQTYCEKLQWLKYYYRNPEYTKLVDKYAVREYVKEKIGEEYLVPLYGVYDSFDEIDFDKLPDQFVLKCTHDSGSVIICKDKSKFDISNAKEKLDHCLKRNQFYLSREWYYKNVKPRIIAEKYLDSGNGDSLSDYKFLCFDGKPELLQIHDILFDDDSNKTESTGYFSIPDFTLSKIKDYTHTKIKFDIPRPEKLDQMIDLSRILSYGIPHVRVDFHCVNNKVYFGEMTFFHGGGRNLFDPEEYNKIIGDMITLPPKMR